MNKKEMIFLLIIIIAFIASSMLLNLPMIANVIFIIALILFLVATLILKAQDKYDNEKISGISRKICSVLIVVYILLLISGFVFKHAFFELHSPIIILIFITLFIGWFFGKNNE